MRQANRYSQMERYMSCALILDLVLFIAYLIAAGNGIIWLKAILFILTIALSLLCLAYLYLTKELLKQRSFWMSVCAGAIAICLLFSLILNFPSPSPYQDRGETQTDTVQSET